MLPKLSMVQLQIARGLALFLGGFTLLNIVGAWWAPGFDANGWWIDVGFMPWKSGHMGLIFGGFALLSLGVGWPMQWRNWARGAVGALAGVTMWNAVLFYALWKLGWIIPARFFGMPVPLSLILTLVLSFIIRGTTKPALPITWHWHLVAGGAFLAALIFFPLAQMECFGKTDYRRKADAIVVFGAKANSDGTASQVLDDRTRAAIALYKAGFAKLLIFSGGPGAGGSGPLSEPGVMKRIAMEEGIPASAIMLDEEGLNTEATVKNTAAIFKEHGIKKVLAVSNDYHLPRIKMTYARTLAGTSVEVYTVPAAESYPLSAKPYFMAREVLALWVYYLRPLWGG